MGLPSDLLFLLAVCCAFGIASAQNYNYGDGGKSILQVLYNMKKKILFKPLKHLTLIITYYIHMSVTYDNRVPK